MISQTLLAYVPNLDTIPAGFSSLNNFLRLIVGTPVGIRTPNLLIRSQPLYPIELRVQPFELTLTLRQSVSMILNIAHSIKNATPFLKNSFFFLKKRVAELKFEAQRLI